MWLCWMEWKRIVKKNGMICLLNLVGILAVLLMTVFSVSYFLDKQEMGRRLKESYDGKIFYKIVYDGDIGKLYETVFRTEQIDNVRNAFEELRAGEWYTYRYADPDCITIKDETSHNWQPEMMYGYEAGQIDESELTLKAIYADHELLKLDSVVLDAGSAFTDADYVVNSKEHLVLPVLAGASYADHFQLGEHIERANMWDETDVTLMISGFLKEGSFFYDNNNQKVIMDRYLVVPDVEIAYDCQSVLEDHFYLGAYDGIKLMNARVICGKADEIRTKERVMDILHRNQLYDFYLHEETEGAYRVYENAKQFIALSFLITSITFVVCLVMMAMVMMARLLRERKAYAIYSLLGIEKKDLFVFALFDQVVTFLAANGMLLSVCGYLYRSQYDVGVFRWQVVGTVGMMEASLFLVVSLIIMNMIHRTDMSSLLRQKE